MLKIIDQLLRIFAAFLGTLIRKIHFPKCALLHRWVGAIIAPRDDVEKMAGREEAGRFQNRSGSGHRRKCKNVIDALPIRPRRNHAGSKQPFDFRGKKQPVSLPTPKERRDSEPIAPELELASALIPQRDRKLPSQPLPHPLAMIFPHMRNDFGVAMRNEPVSATLQVGPALDVIKQLTIKHHEDIPVLIRNRLLTIRQADDA